MKGLGKPGPFSFRTPRLPISRHLGVRGMTRDDSTTQPTKRKEVRSLSSGPLAPDAPRSCISPIGALASSLDSRGGRDPSAKVADAISPKVITVTMLRFDLFIARPGLRRWFADMVNWFGAEPRDSREFAFSGSSASGIPPIGMARMPRYRRQRAAGHPVDIWSNEGEVGSFCCPVLPVPLDSASVARCGPTAHFRVTLGR